MPIEGAILISARKTCQADFARILFTLKPLSALFEMLQSGIKSNTVQAALRFAFCSAARYHHSTIGDAIAMLE